MTERLHVQLLGGLTARRDDFGVFRFQAGKLGATMGLLAYRLGEQLARDQVIELIWPDTDADRGRHCLRQVLSGLRKRLDRLSPSLGSVVVSSHDEVYLDPDEVQTDVGAFLRSVTSADRSEDPDERLDRLCAASDLYVGDLLPGYYDDWTLAERERLAAIFTRALRSLTRQLDDIGETERALDYALRATRAAPDREDLHLDVMRLYCKLGRQSEALRQYHRLEGILRSDYGRAPSNEARALADELAASGFERVKARRCRLAGKRSLCHPGSPNAAAEGRGASGTAGLPAKLTAFFGREDELAFLRRALGPGKPATCGAGRANGAENHHGASGARRLVTLTGPGGCGKTRLALEAGGLLTDAFAGAVVFVPLAGVRDPERVVPAILNAAGATSPSGPSVDAVAYAARQLEGRPRLLLLDNLEDLVPSCAPILRDLLERLPELRILATSRQPLHVEGEMEFRVPPLAVPTRPGTPERLLEFACVQLFVDRAQSVYPDFRMTHGNAPAVAALCERLEGIPLAVELAAGRAHVLTPAQMLTELTDRFGFLVSRRANRDSHHATLRDAISWSFDRLSPDLQRFFAALSVFRGGWSLAGARQVCGSAEALDCLDELAQRSLIVMEERHGAMRFFMLETLREFAAGQLCEDEREELRARHGAFFEALAEEAEGRLRGPDLGRWVAVLEDEHENLRAALDRLEREGPGRSLRMAGALWRFWNARGHVAEGLARLERALAGRPDRAEEEMVARALLGRGALLYRQARNGEAGEALLDSEALFAASGRKGGLASALAMRAIVAQTAGEYAQARAHFERVLTLWQELGDQWGVAGTLNNLARLAQDTGEPEIAAVYYERSHDIYQRQGDTAQLALVLNNRGALAYEQGDFSTAQACFQRSLELCRAMDDRSLVAVTLHNLGDVACRMGDPDEGFPHLSESLAIRQELGDRAGIARSLESLAFAARLRRDYVRSLRLLAAAQAARKECGVPRRAAEQEQFDETLAAARAHVSDEAFAGARRYGSLLALDEAIAYAIENGGEPASVPGVRPSPMAAASLPALASRS